MIRFTKGVDCQLTSARTWHYPTRLLEVYLVRFAQPYEPASATDKLECQIASGHGPCIAKPQPVFVLGSVFRMLKLLEV